LKDELSFGELRIDIGNCGRNTSGSDARQMEFGRKVRFLVLANSVSKHILV
jgi:hypothetical protein